MQMKLLRQIPLFFLFLSFFSNAQDSLMVTQKDSLRAKIVELKETIEAEPSRRFSISATNDTIYLNDPAVDKRIEKGIQETTLIDSLWLKELYNSPLYDSEEFLIKDAELFVLKDGELVEIVLEELPTELLKSRLKVLDDRTPFNIVYNQSLERLIKTYLKSRKKSFSTLMSRAQYYFPMFEEHLDKYDIPLEIKYLAIVESALKPRAKSRVGATGLWQFMYQTGKQFKLNVNSYVDERQDPFKATVAACQYLSALHKLFGDWDLALAAYNSGPGNVNKAIRRSGGKRNYWNIRQFLPRETAGYVPAFYATLYIFEYADEHGIYSNKPYVNLFETDTIHIKKQVTFDQLKNFLDVDIEMIQYLNPQYKLDIIPYRKDKNYYVKLPLYNIGEYLNKEKELHAYIDAEEAKRETALPQLTQAKDQIRYRVRSGDYLGKIANNYGVSVNSIKRWNGLRSNRLRIGQRLVIHPRKIVSTSSKPSQPTQKKVTPKGSYSTYVVKKGDSLWTISRKFPKVSVQNLKEWNNIWSVKSLKPGMKLKIFKS
jgi:membrane-bound lytic murein transglycosylase D